MGYLDNLEHDYVLGNLDVYNEFDSSHFISNAKSAISNKAETVNVNYKFNYYTDMLERAIESFSIIKLDKSKVRDFLIKASDSNIDYSKIMSHDIDTNEVSIFKPQYIGQYITMVSTAIDKSLKGDLSNSDAMKFMVNDYTIKVEKQIVKTSIPYGMTCKDLQKETTISSNFITVDRSFIKEKVIPFVTKYDETKTTTVAEANAVLNAIKEAEVTVKAMLAALDKARTSGVVDFANIKQTNQLAYNAIRGIIDIISFTSFMMIHKLNVISSNVITCNKLYDDVFNATNGNIVESAFDNTVVPDDNASIASDLIDGRVGAFDVLANNIYNYHIGMVDPSNMDAYDKSVYDPSSILSDSTESNYSKAPYDDVMQAYTEISEGLDRIAKEGGEYLLVFNDIMRSSGFTMILQDKYRNVINSIETMTLYDGANNLTANGAVDSMVYMAMLAEAKDFGTNMQTIADMIHTTFEKLGVIQERFANNINGEYSDIETINELRVFMKDLRNQFIDMTELVANNFMNRLEKLGRLLVDMDIANDNTKVDATVPEYAPSNIDISESTFDIEYEEKVFVHKSHFDALQRSYIVEKTLALSNEKVIFEAEQPAANNGTTTTNTTQNNTAQPAATTNTQTTTTNNNRAANQNSTTPTVTDNNQQAAQTNNTNGQIKSSIKDAIANLFTTIINAFSNAFAKQSVKNAKFIADNKEYLTNRSYSNTAVRVVPYSKNMAGIVAELDGVKNKIAALTPQVIQSVNNEADMYKKIIQFSGGLTPDNLATQFTNYFSMGNTKTAPAVKEYTNNGVRDLVVNTMIPFCEDYSSEQSKNTFIQSLTNLQQALTEKCDSLNQQATTESVSIYTEADATQNANTTGSMNDKMKWIEKAVSEMCQSARQVLQNQNNEYLKVLDAFKQKPATSGNAKVSDGNDKGEPANNQTETPQPQQPAEQAQPENTEQTTNA